MSLEYRRLVVSIAEQLSQQERQQVAFIRLIPKYSQDVTGIELLARLESSGVFSQNNIDGLTDIAKDINRPDLIGKIEHYKENATTSTSKQSTKMPRKGTTSSAERRELERTFELLVMKISVMDQHLYMLERTLAGEGDPEDEGKEIVTHISERAQELASDLHAAHEKLVCRIRANSSDSETSSSANNLRNRRRISSDSSMKSSYKSHCLQQKTPAWKPIPKPRKKLGLSPHTASLTQREPPPTSPKPKRKQSSLPYDAIEDEDSGISIGSESSTAEEWRSEAMLQSSSECVYEEIQAPPHPYQ